MRLYQQYATKNRCFIKNQRIKVRGIFVHSTGANNPNLRRYVQPDDGRLGVNNNGNSFNEYQPGGRSVMVSAFIGKLKDGSVATYQIAPWDMLVWHSGVGSKGAAYNMGYIGFEICEDDLRDREYFLATKRDFPLGGCHFDVITLVWKKDNSDYVSEYIPDAYIPIYF